MSLHISHLHLPTNNEGCELIIRIQPDGTVLDEHGIHLDAKAIELKPHGRLGDIDELANTYQMIGEKGTIIHDLNRVKMGMGELIEHLETVHTIIPKETE